jgi:DsbC/DsbD-like thiol-disulfide interchange protein
VSLVGGDFNGKDWHAGVLIELEPGWKTYWRMPGESGLAPEFTWSPSVPAQVEVMFPTPARHADASGETIGYDRQVLLPVTVSGAAQSGLDLTLDLFFGVCKDICIPARASTSIQLGPMARDPLGSARVDAARQALPAPGTAVSSASIIIENGKPVLKLSLARRLDDIFVETTGPAYFHAPRFSSDGRTAWLAVSNLSDPVKLAGAILRLTYVAAGKGYEQTVRIG